MDYEFKNIEFLIREAISSANGASQSLQSLLLETRKSVDEEKRRIKNSFVPRVMAISNSSHKASFIQFHQHSIISFIDELFEASELRDISKMNENSRLSMEIFFFYDQVEDILEFLRTHFPKHFDLDAKLPESQKDKLFGRIKREYSNLENKLASESLDPPLARLWIKPITRILDAKNAEITYQQILYAETIIQDLNRVFEINTAGRNLNETLREVLFKLNYNCREYLEYYADCIRRQVLSTDSESAEIELLAYHYKAVNQTAMKPGFIYDPDLPPIDRQLSEWILQETRYLEKKKMLATENLTAAPQVQKEFKLEFDMTVSQFAFLIRTFIETGIVQNKNITEVIRFLSKTIKTRRSGEISEESFRIKYYGVEASTRDTVKGLLHTAIGHINKT
jgi:hypothetical protein